MSTPLNFGRDENAYNAYAPYTSSNKYSATLAASTVTSITLPTSAPAWIVGFSIQPGASVWVNVTGVTAAVPASGALASTTSELNPGQRTVLGGGTISMITANTTADVGVMLWPTQRE